MDLHNEEQIRTLFTSMSLSKLRKNFYRIASLIIDHGAESMRCLLHHFIQKKFKMSFRDFVSNHQHEMYHHYNNGICCLCSKTYRRPHKTVVSAWQMEKLFDKKSPKISNHKYTSKCEYCCSTVKSTLILQDIDITLLRFFLVTYFEKEFWQSCFSSGMLFHDFLNSHKHDIFHLLQLNTPCCLCQAHPGDMVMLATEKDRLNITHWETMFQVPELPCTQHKSFFPNGYMLNPCSVSATIGIQHTDLDGRVRMIILSKFCTMMKHIDILVNSRNTVFAHAIKGELSDEEFRQLWMEIDNSIMYISNITSTVDSQKLCISELREKSLEESMCLELQCLILKQMHGDELVLEACRKLQDTVELAKESIDIKLQQIELQTSRMSDVMRNELPIRLNEYSGTTRNIIDNTRREIEFHTEDKTYVKTSAVTAATELLDRNNLLIIFGRAGSGKTSTVLEIASLFQEKGYIVMKLEQNLANDFKTYFINKNKQLIIFEDLFGKSDIRYNEDIHSNLLDVMKPHVAIGVSKFIITVRSYKIEVDDEFATNHQLLSKAVVVNLNGSSSLSVLEKNGIIKMHAKHFGREISFAMHSIISTESYLGFPETCRLFCSFDKFFAMGHTFFTSPTKKLQNEINLLKQSGYDTIDSALQYCVLVCLMMDFAYKDPLVNESNDPSNNFKNINSWLIEHLCQLIFNKKPNITVEEVHDICKKLSNKYIKNDVNSDIYIFQHVTVFEAVLSSYWHKKTREDIIKHFKVEILAEHVRPSDYTPQHVSSFKCNKKFLDVPINTCVFLAKKWFEDLLANYSEISKYDCLIYNSKCLMNKINQKLCEWLTIEEDVLNCEWAIIKKITRHFTCLNHSSSFNKNYAHGDYKYLINRFIHELDNRAPEIQRYLCDCEIFTKDFNKTLTERFQSGENLENCNLLVILKFIFPSTYRFKHDTIGTVTNDGWLIQVLIKRLVEHGLSKRKYDNALQIKKYIENYGCAQFVKYFNEKLTESFQSEKIAINCEWSVIYNFVRPTTYTLQIENGHIGVVTKDDWLIQRLSNALVENVYEYKVKDYIKKYGCKQFVKDLNKEITDMFKSEETVVHCKWEVISDFVRPTTFEFKDCQVGGVVQNNWLIQRIINLLLEECKPSSVGTLPLYYVQDYVKKYGDEMFVKEFNNKLTEQFKSQKIVSNSKWMLIEYFGRPTTFKIQNGQIGGMIQDAWLIQRLVNMLIQHEPFKPTHVGPCSVYNFIRKYGCERFVIDFNENLAKTFEAEEHVVNCKLKVIHHFIRPTTFKIENGQIGTFTKDEWLIQRLINVLVKKTTWYRHATDDRSLKVSDYIEKYGCEMFVKNFNEKLMKRLHSEKVLYKWNWKAVYYFVRPTTFQMEIGKKGIVTNDTWLIQKLINSLKKYVRYNRLNHRVERELEVKKYIEKYGCKKFIKDFNDKLTEQLQSNKSILESEWEMIYHFVRPKTFKIEIGNIGAVSNDSWIIDRLINALSGYRASTCDHTLEVNDYIEKYGCDKFVTEFNSKLSERCQSEEMALHCSWDFVCHFVRPTSFKVEIGQIGAITNDNWLTQTVINRLKEYEKYTPTDKRPWEVTDYIEKYGCEQFVKQFNEKLKEIFKSEKLVYNCSLELIFQFVRPTSFKIEIGQLGVLTKDNWLIDILSNRILKRFVCEDHFDKILEVKNYIEKYGCEKFIKDFNEKLTEKFHFKQNLKYCNWGLIILFIRPTSFKIANGQIGILISDDLLIKRLLKTFVEPASFKYAAARILEGKAYIETYGCEFFFQKFKSKLTELILKNSKQRFNLPLFYSFVRPGSSSNCGKIEILMDDQHIIMFLIEKLEEPYYMYEVKSYIKCYGSIEFLKIFNEQLKEKIVRMSALHPESECKRLELYFENVIEFDTGKVCFKNEEDDFNSNSSSQCSDIDSGNTSDSDCSCQSFSSVSDATNTPEDSGNETNYDYIL